jgi:hypothetical protein
MYADLIETHSFVQKDQSCNTKMNLNGLELVKIYYHRIYRDEIFSPCILKRQNYFILCQR